MPTCQNCGYEMQGGMKFCPECGQDQAVVVPQDQRIPTEHVPVPSPPGSAPPKRNLRQFIIIVIVIVVALILVSRACGGRGAETSAGKSNGGEGSGPASGEIFTSENYGQLVADPQGNRGAQVAITGKVFTDPEVRGNQASLQIWADPENSDWHTIVRTDPDSADLNRNDYVRVKGSVLGQFEGENAFGAERQAVEVRADTMESVDPDEALDPAQSTLEVGQTRENQGFSATVGKIEFGQETTRVEVTARNNTPNEVNFSTHNAKILQNSKQVDPARPSPDYDLPKPQSDISPSVETEGVVVFGPVSPSTPFTIELDWSSRGRGVRAQPLVFEVVP